MQRLLWLTEIYVSVSWSAAASRQRNQPGWWGAAVLAVRVCACTCAPVTWLSADCVDTQLSVRWR